MSKPAPSSMSGAMLPLIVQEPSVGSRTPAMILSSVDLPEPLVPRIPKTSPSFTSSEMSSRARNSLKRSSLRASAMKYSFRLLSCSFAILKTIETWSTWIIVFRSWSSEKALIPSEPVLTTSGIEHSLNVENEFLFGFSKNKETDQKSHDGDEQAQEVF